MDYCEICEHQIIPKCQKKKIVTTWENEKVDVQITR